MLAPLSPLKSNSGLHAIVSMALSSTYITGSTINYCIRYYMQEYINGILKHYISLLSKLKYVWKVLSHTQGPRPLKGC
jgi:hypothetical protein